jgi:hypothetical protein
MGIVANVNQTITDVIALSEMIKNDKNIFVSIQKILILEQKKLIALTASSDGLQITQDKLTSTRHFANTLFNIMQVVFLIMDMILKRRFHQVLFKANKMF